MNIRVLFLHISLFAGTLLPQLPIHRHRHRRIDGLIVLDGGAVVPAADAVHGRVVEAV